MKNILVKFSYFSCLYVGVKSYKYEKVKTIRFPGRKTYYNRLDDDLDMNNNEGQFDSHGYNHNHLFDEFVQDSYEAANGGEFSTSSFKSYNQFSDAEKQEFVENIFVKMDGFDVEDKIQRQIDFPEDLENLMLGAYRPSILDQFLDENEIANWLKFSNENHMNKESVMKFKIADINSDQSLTWDELRLMHLRQVELDKKKDVYLDAYHEDFSLEMEQHALSRMNDADLDENQQLNLTEYKMYLHPYNYAQMQKTIISEVLNNLDTNQDDKLDIEEFMFQYVSVDIELDEEAELLRFDAYMVYTHMLETFTLEGVQWFEICHTQTFSSWRELFRYELDQNGDQKLDINEIWEWVFPSNYDPYLDEAKFMIENIDTDQDKLLSKTEILDNFELFMNGGKSKVIMNYAQEIFHDEL